MSFHRIFFANLLLCIVFVSNSLFAQDDSYKNNRDFKETWRQAETGKLWKDRYADYRLATNISHSQCEECISKAMNLAFEWHDYERTLEAANILTDMSTASKRERAVAAVISGLCTVKEDFENANQNDLLKAEEYFNTATHLDPSYGRGFYESSRVLLILRNTSEAKVALQKAIASEDIDNIFRIRAKLFLEHPDWASLNMLPSFSVTSLDGQKIDTASLLGKVVLFVFPRYYSGEISFKDPPFSDMEKVYKAFQGEPFVMVTVFWGPYADHAPDRLKKHPFPWPQVMDPHITLTRLLKPPSPVPAYIIADMRGAVLANVRVKSDGLEPFLRQVIDMNKKVLDNSLAQK